MVPNQDGCPHHHCVASRLLPSQQRQVHPLEKWIVPLLSASNNFRNAGGMGEGVCILQNKNWVFQVRSCSTGLCCVICSVPCLLPHSARQIVCPNRLPLSVSEVCSRAVFEERTSTVWSAECKLSRAPNALSRPLGCDYPPNFLVVKPQEAWAGFERATFGVNASGAFPGTLFCSFRHKSKWSK